MAHGTRSLTLLTTLARSLCSRVCCSSAMVIVAAASVNVGQAQRSAPVRDADPQNTVVVEGRTVDRAARIRTLAQAITPVTDLDHPIARFYDPVCFALAGLSREQLEIIADRLVADTMAAGIRHAGRKCTPNIEVLFVDDSLAELDRLRRTRPGFFAPLLPAEIARLINQPGPAHLLSTVETASRDGDSMSVGGGIRYLKVASASRIDLPIRREVQRAILFVDRPALVGLSLQQIADYAAMRTLTLARPPATGGDTILTLFASDTRARPAAMTGFDVGYLRAAYLGSGSKRGATKVEQIARTITQSE